MEGQCRVGGQEHFYFETQGAVAVPKEDDEMEIFSSTQNPREVQVRRFLKFTKFIQNYIMTTYLHSKEIIFISHSWQ